VEEKAPPGDGRTREQEAEGGGGGGGSGRHGKREEAEVRSVGGGVMEVAE
jgi:hypothetical protein